VDNFSYKTTAILVGIEVKCVAEEKFEGEVRVSFANTSRYGRMISRKVFYVDMKNRKIFEKMGTHFIRTWDNYTKKKVRFSSKFPFLRNSVSKVS
jgi:hypothetical protein